MKLLKSAYATSPFQFLGVARMNTIFSRIAGRQIFSLNLSRFSSNSSVKMSKAVVILASGAEEIELVGSVDVLRRAGVSLFLVCKSYWLNKIAI